MRQHGDRASDGQFGPRAIAATPVRATSTSPIGRISSMNWSILVGAAGEFEDEALGGRVDDAGAKRVGRGAAPPSRFSPLPRNLDHREFALDRSGAFDASCR